MRRVTQASVVPLRSLVALIVGVLAVSLAAPFILLATRGGVGPNALPAWRLLTVGLMLLPFALRGALADLRGLSVAERWRLVGSGVLYGLHFAAFTHALRHTTKESTVVLLAAQPLVAGAVGALFLGERITRPMVASSLVALAGMAVFMGQDLQLDRGNLVGDGLVLLCGLLIVGCYAIGRGLRPRMSLVGYLVVLYLVGGATCLTGALAAGDPLWGYSAEGWRWLATAVLVSTLVGHSAFHYALRDVPVFHVNLSILGEPVLALAFMAAFADRYPDAFGTSHLTALQAVGGAILLGGVALGLLGDQRSAPSRTPASDEGVVPAEP
jgi:drug/metabolite transporter (DMT)-like permease